MHYSDIAVKTDAPYRNAFTYSIPDGLSILPGESVLVPFGRRTLPGIVLRIADAPTFEGSVRPVAARITDHPSVPAHLLGLACWLSERYLAPLYACVALTLPPGSERRPRERLVPVDGDFAFSDDEETLLGLLRENPSAEIAGLARRLRGARKIADGLIGRGGLKREPVLLGPAIAPKMERRILIRDVAACQRSDEPLLRHLMETGGSLPLSAARQLPGWHEGTVRRLMDAGMIEEVEARVLRDPLAGADYPARPAPPLTVAQSEAVHGIFDQDDRGSAVTLLHGVTGSGKTEVYLAAVGRVLAAGRRAVVLVPEIALTAQTIERFAGRFPGRVAVLHSGLTAGQRYDQWCAIRDGRFDVVIGSRGGLFAPVDALGLIVVDEEHEWTYKQQDTPPRYLTRDVAEHLSGITGAALVLGSATPDVVSYARAQRGRYRLAELPQRVAGSDGAIGLLPEVRVADLARELREGNRSIFSRALSDAMDGVLAAGNQTILFLNRRGSASFVLCRDCGHVPRCGRCDVALTLHGDIQRLVCHQCSRSRRAPARCPRCGNSRIRHAGLGTQRVEEEVRRRFPNARIVRWDRDTARKATDHAELYRALQAGEADVLIGTQMIAKGLDLPGVRLVGIINADLSLGQPEFYSAEHAFQLFTQVAGRAGRRNQRGLVILQTYAPNNYVVQAAVGHDYAAFYRREMEFRRKAGYPPFARLTRLVYASTADRQAEAEARRLAQALRTDIAEGTEPSADVLGPVPCPIARLRGRWRWQLILRCSNPQNLLKDRPLPAGWSIDIDPRAFN